MAIAFISGYDFSTKTKLRKRPTDRSSVSESGSMHFIGLANTTYWQLNAVFEQLTESERDTLEDWLETNKFTEIDITLGTTVYRGYIIPETGVNISPSARAPHLWDLGFSFNGVKQ